MAAGGHSRRFFEVFVARVPWTVAASLVSTDTLRMGTEMAPKSLVLLNKTSTDQHQQETCEAFAYEIREYFAQFGSVKKCLLPFDKETGFHKSYCWVGFSTEEGIKNVLQKESHILEGVKLEVKHQSRRNFPGQHSDKRIADIS